MILLMDASVIPKEDLHRQNGPAESAYAELEASNHSHYRFFLGCRHFQCTVHCMECQEVSGKGSDKHMFLPHPTTSSTTTDFEDTTGQLVKTSMTDPSRSGDKNRIVSMVTVTPSKRWGQ